MKRLILVILGMVLFSGCSLAPETTEEEPVLTKTQGLGVTSFNSAVDEIAMGTYNYILMTLRNNAEGTQAKNIKVSLQNVEPFMLYECNELHNPSDEREVLCNQFFNDYRQPYKAHFVDRMRPNEELQFFWNIKAPEKQLLANMRYDHKLYYLLEYDYASTATQTIFCISQSEYLTRSQEGTLQITSQTISSPGEIELTSTTQQPIIYTENDPNGVSFTLSFEVKNDGEGVAKPDESVIIAIRKPSDVYFIEPDNYGWYTYQELSALKNEVLENSRTEDEKRQVALLDEFNNRFNSIEFPELTESIKLNMVIRELFSDQINQAYFITLPLLLDTANVFEPQKILTFNVYISYTYQKEGLTTVKVYPIR